MAIHPTAIVDPRAWLAPDVDVGPYAHIGPEVELHRGVSVGSHAVVVGPTVIGAGTRVLHHAVLGGDPQDKKYQGGQTRLVVGQRNVFREFSTANRGTEHGGGVTRIGDDNLFMAYSHVAHDCTVGSHCVFANSVNLAGHVEVHDHAVLGGLVGVHQHTRVGRSAMVGGGAMVAQDVPPFTIAQGDRARLYGLNVVGLRRLGLGADVLAALKAAYRELFAQGTPLRVAAERVRESWGKVPEVVALLDFVAASRRGTCRSAGSDANPDA